MCALFESPNLDAVNSVEECQANIDMLISASRAMKKLFDYACTKKAAVKFRSEGRIDEAMQQECYADHQYLDIPEQYRW